MPLAGALIAQWYVLLNLIKKIIMKDNNQKRVAILTENGFEETELTSPKKALENAGFKVDVISSEKGQVKAWNTDHWSINVPVDVKLSDANPDHYDALMIPGGVMNPDKMRMQKEYVAFAKEFMHSGKPVAAICHGPQLLIQPACWKEEK